MTLFSRIIVLLMILMLLFTLFSIELETGMTDSMEDDEIPDEEDDVPVINDIPVEWIRIPLAHLFVPLRLGISIFALFVVYLGGRSKARFFNDRTIDPAQSLTRVFFKTAASMFGSAVFYFLRLDRRLEDAHRQSSDHFQSIMISYSFSL